MQLEDLQLVERSTQRLQTTKQKITETNQAMEHITDSTTFKIPSTAAEETSTIAIHEQIDHFTDINGTNNSTAMESFPTHSSLPDSQEKTQSGDLQLAEESTQRPQTTKLKITEPNEVTDQQTLDSTTLTIKISSKAAEETSSIAIHQQIDHFTGDNDANNSTVMLSFSTDSLPDSQETTQSGHPKLVESFQTTKQKITEPDQAIEEHIPVSTTFKIPTITAEEPSTNAIHEQIDHFTGINGTNNSTAIPSFPTDSLPDSQETTQSGDLELPEEPTQHFQTTTHKITETSEITEQHILNSTTFKISSTGAEETSTIATHEQIDHLTGFNGTNNSKTMEPFPTHSSLPDSQETSQSGDSQLAEESTQQPQTTKLKITEPNEVTDQQTLDSTTFTIKISSKAAEESSSITIHEQIDHFTSINGTNNSTAMLSFPTDSLLDSQETTQSGDSQLPEESTQRLQTRKQESTEPSEVTEQHIPDSTTFKIPTIAAEEPSTNAIHEQIDHFTGINGTNISTSMPSFPTYTLPDSQETTHLGDLQLPEESTQHFQTTKLKITEPSEVTDQHIPDSTIFTIKISSKAAEESSSITLHKQTDHFTGINSTNNSTAMPSFPTDSLPGSQETTQSGDSQLAEESTQQLQTTTHKITEPSKVTEQHIFDSTTFTINIPSKAAEEPSSITIYEQMDNFTHINDTNNSTAMASFPTQSSLPDSQETTQSGDSQLPEESTQRLQTRRQESTEHSEVTEQQFPDSTKFTIKVSSKVAEKPSITVHEQIDHFTDVNDTNNSTAIPSFPTHLLPDSQETTQSGDPQLVEHFQTTKQKNTEPDQVIEEYIPDSTTFKIPTIAAEEPSTNAINEQIDHFTGINGTNISTAMPSFPTDSLPDSQETTQSGDLELPEEPTQHFQTTTHKITETSEITEQHILDSTTFKISSTGAEEPSTIATHGQIDHFTGFNGTNNSTAIESFPTHSSLPDSQETTQSGDSQLAEESTQQPQTTKLKITEPNEVTDQQTRDSTTLTIKISSKAAEESSSITIHEQIDHFTSINGTNNSTAMLSFPTDSLLDSQETTQSGDSQLPEESTQRLQTRKQESTEPSEVKEQHIPDSTTFKILTIAAEETSTNAIHEQIDHFTDINGTNISTAMPSFPTHTLPDSQETTQLGDLQLAEESTQRPQTTKLKITEPNEVTDQQTLDSTTFTIKISSKAAEETSSIAIHEQIDHFTGDNDANNSTVMLSFPTDSLPDSKETTQSGHPKLVERFQTTKQKISEPNQAIEEHIPVSTTFKIPTITAEEPSTNAIHEQIDHFTGINGTNNSTAMPSFPTHTLPDSQETTHLGDLELPEEPTQHFQTTTHKSTKPSEVTEQHILDSTTFKIPTIAAEEPSTNAIHEQIDHFTGINGTNISTAMPSFPTHTLPDSQETTHLGDLQLPEESTQRFQTTKLKITEPSAVTDQHIPDSTIFTIKISSKAAEESSSITLHEQTDHFT
ncbi:hypothetical protein M9458_022325, partial [Cirrhinus mrigala]